MTKRSIVIAIRSSDKMIRVWHETLFRRYTVRHRCMQFKLSYKKIIYQNVLDVRKRIKETRNWYNVRNWASFVAAAIL